MTHTMMTHRYYSRAAPTWPEATSRNLGEMGHTLLFPFRLHIFSHVTAAATSMSRDKYFNFILELSPNLKHSSNGTFKSG